MHLCGLFLHPIGQSKRPKFVVAAVFSLLSLSGISFPSLSAVHFVYSSMNRMQLIERMRYMCAVPSRMKLLLIIRLLRVSKEFERSETKIKFAFRKTITFSFKLNKLTLITNRLVLLFAIIASIKFVQKIFRFINST